MKRAVIACLAVVAVAGCMPRMPDAVGVDVRPEQLAGFEKGVATEADVVRLLGAPMSTYSNSDGTRAIVYGFSQFSERKSRGTTIVFDKDGKLQSYHQSETSHMTYRPAEDPR